VANAGVLIGIALLIVELSQNREMMRAQTRHAISDQYINYTLASSTNPEMANIVMRVMAGEELTPDERFTYMNRNRAWFSIAENTHYQYRQGLFDVSEFEAKRIGWRTYANASPGVAELWCLIRDGYSPEFRVEMDSLFDSLVC
jgi:hypothetical protein